MQRDIGVMQREEEEDGELGDKPTSSCDLIVQIVAGCLEHEFRLRRSSCAVSDTKLRSKLGQ